MAQSTYPQNINVAASSAFEAARKAGHLATIAANLNPESLAIIAKASAKPNADGKLKNASSMGLL